MQLKFKRKHSLYQEVFTKEPGRKILEDLVNRHGVFQPTFCPGDPHMSAFMEGKRAVVLDILKFVNIPLDQLERIYKEHDGRDNDNSL